MKKEDGEWNKQSALGRLELRLRSLRHEHGGSSSTIKSRHGISSSLSASQDDD